MGRTRLAKAGIAQLKSQIQQAQRRKKHLLDYLSKLEKAHSEKKISYAHYVETLHKKHNGRNIHELIHYYGHHIKECEKHLKHHKKQVHIGRAPAYAVGILIILALMFFSSPSTFKFTGFFVSEGENATAGENATGIEEIIPNITAPENITIPETNITIPSENITTRI
ncbi:hypothetical protein HYT23_05690 [Candidatus Pacearchaeota archaeon]|nr:hypothetical protein [Candidatus Pacearchaeota archaeon]